MSLIGSREVLSKAAAVALAVSLLGVSSGRAFAQQQGGADAAPAGVRMLETGWRFHKGDIPFPVIRGQGMSYGATKAGQAIGAAASDYDDSDWPRVDLPHDWAVATPIDRNANLSQGFHNRGFGWYRRSFNLPQSSKGKSIEIQFDGIATHATVWVNGILAAQNNCGYTSFVVDITPYARYGDDRNDIAVRVDAEKIEGWWYEGAGIYRHVRLVERNAVHIANDGLYANPVRDAAGKWTVPIELTLASSDKAAKDTTAEIVLTAPDGREVGRATAAGSVSPFKPGVIKTSIAVDSPELWSVDKPTLYGVRATLRDTAGNTLDEVSQNCGFRTLRFDADTGFYLNDQPLKIKGTCNHQDNAGVGVAVPDSLWEWRLRRLKELGSNAYRCSHNPPAKEFLDAADKVGMLVLNENRNFLTSPDGIAQLQWLIRRDRSRPSVFMWSVFNEEPMQGTEQGYEMVRRMNAAVKELDTTRPVTAAISGGILSDNGVAHACDVVGFNYQHGQYDAFHKKFPHIPMLSSEDTSAVMTRGEWVTDKKEKFILESYDTQWQPWGLNHRTGWKLIDTRPFMAGGFVWTGFDYRGEPQPLDWPSTGSSFGIMDECGFPKFAYYLHQAMWIKDRPILEIAPHWNWAGDEGKPKKVMLATNVAEADVSLNGKSFGRKKIDPYMMAEWSVPYEPGELLAVGYDASGREIARQTVRTTGDAVALEIVPDRNYLNGDGRDAQPVTVRAIDAEGRVVPTAKPFATFAAEGPAKILGVGNGDPLCHEPDLATTRTLYNGLVQMIVGAREGAGAVTLTATANGLKPASVTLDVRAAKVLPSVAVPTETEIVRRWRMSPPLATKPEPTLRPGETDMNTWTNVEPGRNVKTADGQFALLRTRYSPRAAVRSRGGRMVFQKVVGTASVYFDGKLVGEKTDAATADLEVALPSSGQRVEVSVILNGTANTPAGLMGQVTVDAAKP